MPRLIALTVAALALMPAAARAEYGVGEHKNVPVTMSDGVVLRANVYYPTDLKTGKAARGPFPVIMVQTPYGKDITGAASGQEGGAEAATEAGPLPYFVKRGYIDVVAEIRGTGDSGGTFNLLDSVQARDGVELVDWASKLPESNGRVGMYGPSYMGLIQFMTAARERPGSPLKALFPIVAGADTYRDLVFMGGILDGEFAAIVIGTIFGGLEELAPLVEAENASDLIAVEAQHAPALLSYNATQIANIELGGDQAYDEDYWQARAPVNMLQRIVDNKIPAYVVGGYDDVYQRGEPLVYSGFQNAWSKRPVKAPMSLKQRVTGRYQLLQGPWYHLTAGTGVDIYKTQLAWFDRWLKDVPTGIDKTKTPLHVYELSGKRWADTTHYPFAEAKPTTLYLGPNGTLGDHVPADASGSDTVAYVPVTSPCTRQTAQWSMGGEALVLQTAGMPEDPCTKDDRTFQLGPGALTYTSAPMKADTTLAGPVDATIYASSNRAEVQLVATLQDIAPDGSSLPLSQGALLGSFRALDNDTSWWTPDHKPLLPYHPYTRESVVGVPTGKVTRYDIEVFPTVARIAKGHQLRLTLTTNDTPHLLPTRTQAADLAGGIYDVQRNKVAASFVELPLVASTGFPKPVILPEKKTKKRKKAAPRKRRAFRRACASGRSCRRGRARAASAGAWRTSR
jgi:putative CocE/NonD family hydrolase